MTKQITIADITATCTRHHTSLARGYVSRKGNQHRIEAYKGRFGEGYAVYTANYDSTGYCYVTYYIKD